MGYEAARSTIPNPERRRERSGRGAPTRRSGAEAPGSTGGDCGAARAATRTDLQTRLLRPQLDIGNTVGMFRIDTLERDPNPAVPGVCGIARTPHRQFALQLHLVHKVHDRPGPLGPHARSGIVEVELLV